METLSLFAVKSHLYNVCYLCQHESWTPLLQYVCGCLLLLNSWYECCVWICVCWITSPAQCLLLTNVPSVLFEAYETGKTCPTMFFFCLYASTRCGFTWFLVNFTILFNCMLNHHGGLSVYTCCTIRLYIRSEPSIIHPMVGGLLYWSLECTSISWRWNLGCCHLGYLEPEMTREGGAKYKQKKDKML